MSEFANITEGLRFRIVLEPGFALGPGKADLLAAITDTHSTTEAASCFGMSYKRSWSLIRELNGTFAEPLVETSKGGSGRRRRQRSPHSARAPHARPLWANGGRCHGGDRRRNRRSTLPPQEEGLTAELVRRSRRFIHPGPRSPPPKCDRLMNISHVDNRFARLEVGDVRATTAQLVSLFGDGPRASLQIGE
jgi:hypothetical protein